MCRDSGLNPLRYKYFDASSCGLDFSGLTKDLSVSFSSSNISFHFWLIFFLRQALPDGSAVVFHACAHNPTGVDPSAQQWGELSKLCSSKNFLPFFDMAYQVPFSIANAQMHRALPVVTSIVTLLVCASLSPMAIALL